MSPHAWTHAAWAASALALGAFEFRLYALGRRADALEDGDKAGRMRVLRAVRWAGLSSLIAQSVLFFVFLLVSTPLHGWLRRASLPWYLAALLIQSQLQFRLEKRLRRTDATALEHLLLSSRLLAMSLLQPLLLIAANVAVAAGYAWLLGHSGLPAAARQVLLWPGEIACLAACVFLYYAASPWLVRLSVPCEPVTDAALLAAIERCFERAQVKVPDSFIMKLDRFGIHNALIVGLRARLSRLPSALLLTRSIVENLAPDEFEAVMLHEVSHVALKHVSRRLLQGFLVLAGGAVLGATAIMVLQTFFTFNGLLPMLALYPAVLLFNFLAARRQVRGQELDADAHAVLELGAKRDALVAGLLKLISLNDMPADQDDPSTYAVPYAGHPTVKERASQLDLRLAGAPRPADPWKRWPAAAAGALSLLIAWGWLARVRPRHALRAAAERGDLAALESARAAGADLDAQDPEGGKTPLIAAIGARSLPAAEWLLAHGAGPGRPDEDGFRPMYFAVMTDDPAFVGLLHDHGTRLDEPVRRAQTPLSLARHARKDRVRGWLAAAGATR